MVYADLLIPGQSNATTIVSVLIIMDGCSNFITIKLLTSNNGKKVNHHMQEYILWEERQAGRYISNCSYKVKQVLSDKGREFCNDAMEAWYRSKGIVHVKVGPKGSQLNLCERTHQSIEGMTKSTMAHAGFLRSLWAEAMRNAVYVKNRVYNKSTQGIPYEIIFGVKPDIQYIRKFGALAYAHVPVSPVRNKNDVNVKIGFVLGCEEDLVGCKAYFPDEHTVKFVSDLRVTENIIYRDRHDVEVEEDSLSSLHFNQDDNE